MTREEHFRHLCSLEPRLATLFEEASQCPESGDYCAHAAWYTPETGVRARMEHLAGCEADPDVPRELWRYSAYDTAYEVLYAALPDCRHFDTCWYRVDGFEMDICTPLRI